MARPSSSAVQLKAVVILALLAGHEAVRITEEAAVLAGHRSKAASTPEEDFQALNKHCTWSMHGFRCLGDGCARRALPLDWPPPADQSCRRTDEWMVQHDGVENLKMSTGVLAAKSQKYAASCKGASALLNLKCVRRAKQMMRAMKFIAKADSKKDLMNSLSPEDKAEQKQLFESSLDNVASTMGNDDPYILELVNKMKANPAVKKDPRGSIQTMIDLLWKLREGSQQEKEDARAAIRSMSTSPLTKEEEEEADRDNLQLADQLDGEGEGDLARLMDAVDTAAPDDDEMAMTTGAGSAGSLIEVHRGWAVNVIAFALLAALAVVVVIYAVMEVVAAIVAWALIAVLGCGAYTAGHDAAAAKSNSQVAKKGFTGFAQCFIKAFGLPFFLVGNAIVATWNYFFEEDRDPKKGSMLQLDMVHNGTVH